MFMMQRLKTNNLKYMWKNKYIVQSIIFFLLISGTSVQAQEKSQVVDEIIAKVDNFIILKSDLEKSYRDFMSRNQQQLTDKAAKCAVLEQLVIQKLMVAKAEIDSVVVEDEAVMANLDRKMQYFIAQIGSEEEIENYYGKTIEEFKEELKEDEREQMLVAKMQQEITKDVNVTPAEVKKFFEAIPQDSLPFFATEVSIAQIVKKPEIGQPQKLRARQKMMDIRRQIMQGLELTSTYQEYQLSLEANNTLVVDAPAGTFKGIWGLSEDGNYITIQTQSDVPALSRLNGDWIVTIKENKHIQLLNKDLENQTNFTLASVKDEPINRISTLSLTRDWKITEAYSSGTSFAIMAKEYSQDPGSGAKGGNLGWHKRGELVPPFEAAALTMKPGEISMPIESEFGYHLIQLIERRGNQYDSRHILIKTTSSISDIEVADNYLDSLRNVIKLDSISFEKAAKEYSDDKQTSGSGGYILDEMGAARVPVDQLDPTMYFTIDTMQVGEISRPIKFTMPDGSDAVKIVYYKSKTPPHQASLKEDYNKIQNAALREKKVRITNEWFEEAQSEVFVFIDDDYRHCDILDEAGTAMRR
jgi:parvulin-like peptidyl-prolyl isomerase